MPPWLFNLYIDAVMKDVKMGMGRRGEREMRLLWFLYADDLILCGESEEGLWVMVICFVGV